MCFWTYLELDIYLKEKCFEMNIYRDTETRVLSQYYFSLSLKAFEKTKVKNVPVWECYAYISEVFKICKCKFYPSFISKEKYTYNIIMPVCLSTYPVWNNGRNFKKLGI